MAVGGVIRSNRSGRRNLYGWKHCWSCGRTRWRGCGRRALRAHRSCRGQAIDVTGRKHVGAASADVIDDCACRCPRHCRQKCDYSGPSDERKQPIQSHVSTVPCSRANCDKWGINPHQRLVSVPLAASVDFGRLYGDGVAQILIVEDDPGIRQSLSRALAERGHGVTSAGDAMSGLKLAVEDRPDVVLLDLGLPDMDGGSMLKMLRAVTDVPVVVISARDEDIQQIRLLNLGADDYVVKPFSPDHIDARVRAVLRRVAQVGAGPIVVGGLVVDVGARTATLDGEALTLSRREFDLLAYLAARPGQVVTKRELLSEVWQQPYGAGEKTIDVHASWLRRKLGESAEAPRYLHSVRGVGLRVSPPENDEE